MARRAVQRREVRRVVDGDVIVNFRQQHAAETFGQRDRALIFRAARLAETFDLRFHFTFAGRHFVALDGGFTLALQQLLHVFGHLLAVFQRLSALIAELARASCAASHTGARAVSSRMRC